MEAKVVWCLEEARWAVRSSKGQKRTPVKKSRAGMGGWPHRAAQELASCRRGMTRHHRRRPQICRPIGRVRHTRTASRSPWRGLRRPTRREPSWFGDVEQGVDCDVPAIDLRRAGQCAMGDGGRWAAGEGRWVLRFGRCAHHAPTASTTVNTTAIVTTTTAIITITITITIIIPVVSSSIITPHHAHTLRLLDDNRRVETAAAVRPRHCVVPRVPIEDAFHDGRQPRPQTQRVPRSLRTGGRKSPVGAA